MPMQAHADALPLVTGRAGGRRRRQTAVRSDQDRHDVESGKPEIQRDAFAFYNHAGAIAVAIAWLVIYGIAAVHLFITWSLSLLQ